MKLHLVVNEQGKLLNITVTAGNIDDRKPVLDFLNGLSGRIFADRGDVISKKLSKDLLDTFGIHFFAKLRRNQKNQLVQLNDKLLSRKRSIIKTVIDQL